MRLEKIEQYWHEKGHLNIDQRDFLVERLSVLKPKACLEIGFATGRSTVTILVAAEPKILISVDSSLDYLPGGRKQAKLLQSAFPALKVIEGDSQRLLSESFFQRNFPEGLDFAFIDGDHGYNGCWFDLIAIFIHLNPNGAIFVDDYKSGRPNGVAFPSVNRAVEEFVRENHLVLERWYKEGKGIAVITGVK